MQLDDNDCHLEKHRISNQVTIVNPSLLHYRANKGNIRRIHLLFLVALATAAANFATLLTYAAMLNLRLQP